ncbi:radical SAM/SPASM domain-containing protein [Lacticaseibacillus absianus]|uniref:radical SAM/SPASM domain-containing protein n=1 Tax=Lacticaseibacillus absianus TaxID=2729623 RepID=UPI0015CCAC04|nr:SPASM domain-containing protein [Lacticaseibacillus absianus]
MKKTVNLLIKPASALCNLRCKYCFYANISSIREVRSYGKMKAAVVDEMIPNVYADLNDGDELSIAFQGGEPTLAGLSYFEHFIDVIEQQPKRVKVHYAIQTNGTIMSELWMPLLRDHHFLVGLSIDGGPLYHDLNRVDTHERGTFWRVLKTKALFDQYGIDYNVLCVLTNELAKHPQKVYKFFQEQDVQFIQFIPCLDDLDATAKSDFALTPERFASFYQQLFPLWCNELKAGRYRSVKLFDDVLNLFLHGQVNACGLTGQCQIQYVIEADGSVYPCDFYALDEYRLGYIQESTLRELFSQPIAFDWLNNKRTLPTYCDTCPFKQMCCGGCKRMKDAMYVAPSNRFCGYRTVLETVLPQAEQVMQLVGQCGG